MAKSLTARAEALLVAAKELDKHLEDKGIPYPDFNKIDLDGLPADVQEIRFALGNQANDLKKLMRGPVMHTIDVAMGWTDQTPLLVIYDYKLAHAVPLDGDASYADIASTSGLSESLCRRFLRCAMSNSFFDEDPQTGRVRHTAYSRELVTNKHLYDAVGFQIEDVASAALKLPAVWKKYGQDVGEQERSAFSFSKGTDLSMYKYYSANPGLGRRFGSAMQFYTSDATWNLHHMLGIFDWTSDEFDKPGALIVDVGGGHGQISHFLARNTKNVHFLVQDMEPVIERAQKEVPEDIKDRIHLEVHDFFTPQSPVVSEKHAGPVTFFMRYISHNWSDGYFIQILNNLRPALQPGSKVLIMEFILDDFPNKDLTRRFGFQADMVMATLFNALERRAVDFEQLVKAADSRFKVNSIRTAPGSTMTSIVEVVWNGDSR